ncbi:serine protease [Limnoraphis robusta]|uniref:Serine protease n=1 Tax=Limnoraphis robusta CCNP1315 TaxID=3110306 RepID=A0ABU5TTF4_9CYAN|nr:serine protease [Limnoraphis robusta]MEA5497550.1 serine protease [Limnoraphis robusta BA-68 BA1]MEA5517333.1 serine protease [Limnoraphis robusta CCNP1315]MEA5546078.1 serine protease [Limnoraphis robusta CCNP1324]
MRVLRWFLAVLIGFGIALLIGTSAPATETLTPQQIDAMASQTTVLIAEGLKKGDLEAKQEWLPGSGVIVAKQGKTYYALTAFHVVRVKGTTYGVRTNDGQVHFVSDKNVRVFGKELGKSGEKIDGFDLALVKFESDRNYPVAVMGNSESLHSGESTYVSGWPNPEDLSARRVRVLSDNGKLNLIVDPPSEDGGYSLLYNNQTRPGMSGGPVFNTQGELIGIHGRGRGTENNCSPEDDINRSNSCGMQSIHFIDQATKVGLQLVYAEPPVQQGLIEQGRKNKARADVINNIYEDFTTEFLPSGLRDRPSSGCNFLLIPDCD